MGWSLPPVTQAREIAQGPRKEEVAPVGAGRARIWDLVLVHFEVRLAPRDKCWSQRMGKLRKTGAGKPKKALESDLDLDSGESTYSFSNR